MEECGELIAACNHYLRSGKDQKQQAEYNRGRMQGLDMTRPKYRRMLNEP